jgi:hypothetical protein
MDKRLAHKKPDVCKPYSCKIDKCMRETGFKEWRCQQQLNDMIDCCRKWREEAFSCEGFMWIFKKEFEDINNSNKDNNNNNSNQEDIH